MPNVQFLGGGQSLSSQAGNRGAQSAEWIADFPSASICKTPETDFGFQCHPVATSVIRFPHKHTHRHNARITLGFFLICGRRIRKFVFLSSNIYMILRHKIGRNVAQPRSLALPIFLFLYKSYWTCIATATMQLPFRRNLFPEIASCMT